MDLLGLLDNFKSYDLKDCEAKFAELKAEYARRSPVDSGNPLLHIRNQLQRLNKRLLQLGPEAQSVASEVQEFLSKHWPTAVFDADDVMGRIAARYRSHFPTKTTEVEEPGDTDEPLGGKWRGGGSGPLGGIGPGGGSGPLR